ncbi:Ser/Thr protein kinase RdoA involved in Cpx stress response, MazF antagonist [Gemmobacter aquatilis]|uniref:Ser/Thr protein kinase RdoA involved in Cpx stress response, MazF antagonist n=1 Tax=Gemmobacter aquatilis TaxID=933059 RepID=A0A1H7ZUK6_9RHOB|nr:phosphotransferase [Gemmobacter aquatilis]SEM62115.1 Ser/Thr protein kinase RdoA involved in Cpx stress response, MazF antagonist [Gemmobacter aquatilis]
MTEAEEAARHWGGTDLRELRNRENAVYAMRLPDGRRAALRLHRMGYQGADAIRSELWLCAALAERGLPVPAPITTTSGETLPQLSTRRHASAIGWIAGEPFGEAGVPLPGPPAAQQARHRALGRLLAEIHTATDSLTLPASFTRPRWDIDGLVGETPFWGRFWEHPQLSPDAAATLRRARAFLRDRLTDHARTAPLAPIHADVLRENILVSDHLSLIDFDDSGIGFRLYDLGTVLSQDLYEPQRPALQEALIDGYASLRPLDPAMVPVFTLARVLASVGWAAPRLPPEDPVHRSHIARAVMWADHVLAGGR